jgi:hypothetical protein
MKIIFLDIDGVLNTEKHIIYQVDNKMCNGHEAQFNFDPVAMSNLRELVIKTDANVVISSSWRIGIEKGDPYWSAILDNFAKYHVPTQIIGFTPILNKQRGDEIRKWLEDNKELNIESFVILDDDSDMCEFTNTHLAKCSWKNGFTDDVKEKALKILESR